MRLACVGLAALVGVVAASPHAAVLPTWSEELRAQPQPLPWQLLPAPGGALWHTGDCRQAPQLLPPGAPFRPTPAGDAAPTLIMLQQPPLLSLCVGEHAWPLLVVGYYGSALWSAPADLAFRLGGLMAWRGLAGLVGGLGLGLLGLWLWRLCGGRSALFLTAATAATGCFGALHAIAVPYELLAWPLIWGALLLITKASPPLASPDSGGDGDGALLSSRRAFAVSVLLGLALSANGKSLFLLLPLLIWLVRFRLLRRPARVSAVAVAASVGAAIGLAPALLPTLGAGGGALAAQGSMRLDTALQRLHELTPSRALANLLALLDTLLDFDRQVSVLAGAMVAPSPLRPLFLGLAGLGLGLGLGALIAGPSLNRHGARIAAPTQLCALAALQVAAGWAVSTFLYGQVPQVDGLYLHGVAGVVFGGALLASCGADAGPGARLAARLGPRARAGVAALVVVGLGWTGHRNLGSGFSPLGFTLPQQRVEVDAIAAALAERPAAALLTTTYNDHGVVEALTGAAVRGHHAHRAFDRCQRLASGRVAQTTCLRDVAGQLLDAFAARPLLVQVLVRALAVDQPHEALIAAAIEQAALSRGRGVERSPLGARSALLRVSAGAQGRPAGPRAL